MKEKDKNPKTNLKIEQKDKYSEVYLKTRKQIFFDNLIGGIAWGLGGVIGATIIVGVIGIILVNTKRVPLLGDIVKIAVEQIKNGAEELRR